MTGFMAGTTDPISGSFGPGVTLYGPNLTPDPTTGVGNWDDAQLTNAILNGIDNQGERLCPQMGHFPDMGADELASNPRVPPLARAGGAPVDPEPLSAAQAVGWARAWSVSRAAPGSS